MASLSLVFDILARDNASGTFKKVGDEADRAGTKLGGAARGADAVVGSIKAAGAAFAGAAIISGFKALYDAAAESQRIGRLTEAAIRSTGGAANVTAGQVGNLAAAISAKTGIDDEAIQSGQNLLLTFTNVRNEVGAGNDIFNQSSAILADMSTVLGTDASGSAIQLGKALNDPIKGIGSLSRAGIQFTEQQKDQIRTLVESGDTLGAQQIILAELTTQFGGAAEAAATPLDKMKVAVGNVAEAVGGALIPIVDDFATNGLLAIQAISDGFSDGETSASGFEGVMQNVGVALGTVAAGAGAIVDVGQALFGFFTDLPGPVQAAVGAVGAFVLLKGPVSAALETIALKALYARDSIVATSIGMGSIRGAASGVVGLLGGPWGVAIGAATIGLGFLIDGLGESKDVAADAETAQRTFADAVRESNGAIDENVRAAAAKAAQDAGLLDIADDLGLSLPQVTDAVLGNRDAYDTLVGSANAYYDASLLQQNAGDLGMTENADQVRAFTEGLDILVPTVDQTRQEQEALAGATAQSTTALGAATPVAEDFTVAMEANQQATSDAKTEVDAYKLALDILTGANVSLIDVQSAYYDSLNLNAEALVGLEGTVANANGQLNLQSEAGRFASDTLLDIRNSGNQLISTMQQQGATSDEVRAQDANLRQSFIDTALEMGFSEASALDLANQILGIPEERQVQIDANTDTASGNITDLQTQIDGLRGKDITIRASTSLSGLNGGPVPTGGRAMGGPIFGPGSGTSDTAGLFALSNGEHVWTAAEVSAAGGHSAVESLRQEVVANGRGFAAGGPIINIGLPSLAGLTVDAPAEVLASMSGNAGSGSVGGTWQSIFNYVKARIPQARENSSFRKGDPGYHGRGKAIDFGFGSGPGGAGSPGLASINRLLHDGLGSNLAELIYSGIGDDRPDLKNGRPLNYGATTNAQHKNHVHAATFDWGGSLTPGLNLLMNNTGATEYLSNSTAAINGFRDMLGKTGGLSMPQFDVARLGTPEGGKTEMTNVTGFANHGTIVLADMDSFAAKAETSKRASLAALGLI